MNEPDLKALQDFVGSIHHQEILNLIRQRLAVQIAAFLGEQWDERRMRDLHAKAHTYLEVLAELRLDTIDLDVYSSQVVAQFESQLPQRADYAERLRQSGDQAL